MRAGLSFPEELLIWPNPTRTLFLCNADHLSPLLTSQQNWFLSIAVSPAVHSCCRFSDRPLQKNKHNCSLQRLRLFRSLLGGSGVATQWDNTQSSRRSLGRRFYVKVKPPDDNEGVGTYLPSASIQESRHGLARCLKFDYVNAEYFAQKSFGHYDKFLYKQHHFGLNTIWPSISFGLGN